MLDELLCNDPVGLRNEVDSDRLPGVIQGDCDRSKPLERDFQVAVILTHGPQGTEDHRHIDGFLGQSAGNRA